MEFFWYWILGLFFTFFSLVGNSWVIFIITKRRRLQVTSNWFILSLAAADISVTCGYFPASMICFVHTCNNDVRLIFAYFFQNVSVMGFISMIAERYIAVVHPLKYIGLLTASRTVITIATCWAIPFLLTIYRLIIYLTSRDHFFEEWPTFFLICTVLFKVLPTMLLLAAHLRIVLIARKLSHEMKTFLKQVRFNVAVNSVKIRVRNVGLKASTVRLVSALVTIFIACYGIEIYIVICFYFKICEVSTPERIAFNLLVLANSMLNSLVYALFKEDIKRESKAFLCRRRKTLEQHPFQVYLE